MNQVQAHATRTVDRGGAAAAWARSGLMALSGPREGAPAMPAFDAMSGIAALLSWLEVSAMRVARPLQGDLRWLTERAALMGLQRRGPWSCNGSCRLIESRDGWVAVNLPRATDLESVPAFVGCGEGDEPWSAIAHRAASMSSAELVEAGRLLGLAVARVGWPECREASVVSIDDAVRLHRVRSAQTAQTRASDRDWHREPPLVIDLSALWAGPLCAHLLQSAGARVIKVESAGRPDSVRHASPAFFDLLNAGKESVVLDFTSTAGRERLRSLIARADLVIGSARPRAFEQLGLEPEALIDRHPGLGWVAITAHGWYGEARNAVGFGDDAAAAGGLLTRSMDGRPMFAGDALADPLTGIAAAAVAFTALAQGGGTLVDAALSRTAAFIAGGRRLEPAERGQVVPDQGQWCLRVAGESECISAPHARRVSGRAAGFGADTRRVLDELVATGGPGYGASGFLRQRPARGGVRT